MVEAAVVAAEVVVKVAAVAVRLAVAGVPVVTLMRLVAAQLLLWPRRNLQL